MKTRLHLSVLAAIILLFAGKVSAQISTDNATYYYNNMESATSGTVTNTGTGATSVNSASVRASNTLPLAGSMSLASTNTNAIGAIRWNLVGNGTSGVNLDNNEWEWSFVYQNTSTSAPNDPDQIGANNNAWRYWLIANGSYADNTMQGFYISQSGTDLVLRYRYDTYDAAGRYNTLLTTPLANDQKTYIIKVQRLKNGTWAIYKDVYVAGMTTAVTKAVSTTANTGSDFKMYYYSYLQCASTTIGRFKWDNFDMYTRSLSFSAVNGAAYGITQPPYYQDQAVIIYGLKITARGNFAMGAQMYFAAGGNGELNAYFNEGKLYKSTDAFFSTTEDLVVANHVQLTGTADPNGGYAYDLSDIISSAGNTDGTPSVPGYYFLATTTKSQLNYNNPIPADANITITGVTKFQEYNDQSGTAVYSNVSTTSNTYTFANAYDWKGGTSTDWNLAANWKTNAVPGSTNIARIGYEAYTNTTNQPKLPASGTISPVSGIVFGSAQANTILDLNGKTLTVTNGITLNSAANTAINSSAANGALTISGGNSVMSPTSKLAVGANATLNSNGTSFTVQANANSAASIGISAGTITGSNFYVQKYITGNNNSALRGYRFLSSPVNTGSAKTLGSTTGRVSKLDYLTGNTLSSNLPITTGDGNGLGSSIKSGFDKAGNPTIYVYREDRKANGSVFSGGNYIGLTNITNEALSYVSSGNTTTGGFLPVGNGFAMFYRGSKTALARRTAFPNPMAPDNVILSANGSLNQGSIPVVLWYNSATANSYQDNLSFTSSNTSTGGYNLIGNPYACTIDWHTFSTTNSAAGIYANQAALQTGYYVTTTIYTLQAGSNQFSTYTYNGTTGSGTNNGTRYIGSGQSFFVRVQSAAIPLSTNVKLTFNEAAKAPGNAVTTFSIDESRAQVMKLKLAVDSINTDEIAFAFSKDGDKAFLPQLDAPDLGGISPKVSLSGIEDGGKYMAFKNLPAITEGSRVKVMVDATTTGNTYTLSGNGFETLDPRYYVYLVDHFKNDSLVISLHKNYTFNIDKTDTTTFGKNRFELVFHKIPFPKYQLLSIKGDKVSDGAKINWETANENKFTTFELQKKVSGNDYITIYKLQSDSLGKYGFVDKAVQAGDNIYRLLQNDIDGNITYSTDVKVFYANVSNNFAKENISIYPNPASSMVNVNFKGSEDAAKIASDSYSISVVNSNGNTLKTDVSSKTDWTGNVSSLQPGTYFIQVINNNNKNVVGKSKFVKL